MHTNPEMVQITKEGRNSLAAAAKARAVNSLHSPPAFGGNKKNRTCSRLPRYQAKFNFSIV